MLARKINRVLLFRRSELRRKLCTLDTPAEGQNGLPQRKKSSIPPTAVSSLYRSLSALNQSNSKDDKASVDRVLNEWIQSEGISAGKDFFLASVDYLRRFKKFHQALQVLDWTEKRGLIYLSAREHAIYISLTGKTHGVAAAEKYFADLPDSAKKKSTYGALLHCYCCAMKEKKAIALLEKMQARNFPMYSFDYCSMMSLHLNLGQPEKVPLLMKEMKEKRIKPHLFSFKLLITSYSRLKDVESAERVAEVIKAERNIRPDWCFYSTLAGIYISNGLLEKAELNLKEIERLKPKDPRAFHFLLNHYASMGKGEEVDRIWQSLKSTLPKTNNLSYLTMLQVLFRLEDMAGIKRCFEEWESCCPQYDVRLANVLIKAYLKRDMIEEAKLLLDHILKKGYVTNFATYVPFIDYYMRTGDTEDLVLKFIEIATSHVRKEERKSYISKARMYLTYFEEKENDYHVKELHRMLQQADWVDISEIWNNRASERTDEVDTNSENETELFSEVHLD